MEGVNIRAQDADIGYSYHPADWSRIGRICFRPPPAPVHLATWLSITAWALGLACLLAWVLGRVEPLNFYARPLNTAQTSQPGAQSSWPDFMLDATSNSIHSMCSGFHLWINKPSIPSSSPRQLNRCHLHLRQPHIPARDHQPDKPLLHPPTAIRASNPARPSWTTVQKHLTSPTPA
jgi:hypothetical protein